ncbi:hypothetical protein HK104_010545 [Borealophlyctis nickersoniae]|nr:hypothetical protein HK104_010545 [Borealophlyctis nickersoniae]
MTDRKGNLGLARLSLENVGDVADTVQKSGVPSLKIEDPQRRVANGEVLHDDDEPYEDLFPYYTPEDCEDDRKANESSEEETVEHVIATVDPMYDKAQRERHRQRCQKVRANKRYRAEVGSASRRWILPRKRVVPLFSDGDKLRHPAPSSTVIPDDMRPESKAKSVWLPKLGLADFPEGYRLYAVVSLGTRKDQYLYGHPSRTLIGLSEEIKMPLAYASIVTGSREARMVEDPRVAADL